MSNNSIIDNVFTFWELLKQYKVVIPIIQRDYAQGRDTKDISAIRKELLTSIRNSLTTQNTLNFDFVYGTLKDDTLYPLDGQQRLTTFYLLHWYAAVKEGRLDEVSDILSKFSYETRTSSRDFCSFLVNLSDFDVDEKESVAEKIKDRNNYYRIWDNDPTIKAMLIMLNSIHECFYDVDGLLDLLLIEVDDDPLITFNFLKMNDYALTDDLYIKMNARGKPLTDFENFKAKFIQHLKDNGFDSEHFEKSIDNPWTDLLWGYRDVDDTIDDAFMYLFKFLTDMILLESSEYEKDVYKDFDINDLREMIDFYDDIEKVELLYKLLDIWPNSESVEKCLSSIFCDEHEVGKVRVFGNSHNIFKELVSGESVNLLNRYVLYCVMRRMINHDNKTDKDINEYARIVRNLALKCRAFRDGRCEYTPDFNFGRQCIANLKFVLDNLIDLDDIYVNLESVKETKIYDGINTQLKEEKEKAKIINTKPDVKEMLFSLEDLDIFKSSIDNVLDYAINEATDGFAADLKITFTPDYFVKLVQALVSINDYSITIGSSTLGDRHFFGNNKDWYHLLSYEDRRTNGIKDTLKEFFKQYFNTKSSDIEESLDEIISTNISKYDKNDWQYYLIKYPSLIDNICGFYSKSLVYSFEPSNSGPDILHRINGTSLGAYHSVAYYLEVCNDLNDFCSINKVVGTGEESEIIINEYSYYVTVDDENNLIGKYNSLNKKNKLILDKVNDIYNKLDLKNSDIIECIKKYCTMIYQECKSSGKKQERQNN